MTRSSDDLEAVTTSQDPVSLHSSSLGDLNLVLRHQFWVVKDEDAPRSRRWKVRTAAYFYQIDDASGAELVAWHWHPESGVAFPHVHVSGGRLGKPVHLPTGRVSVESVLRLLLTELEVPPTRQHKDDYDRVLDVAEKDFIAYRSWHA
jgi:hypothetical protein